MNERTFLIVVAAVGLAFTVFFAAVVIPPLIQHPDVLGAFAAGFVNPYASGYSADVFACWFILLAWVIYEARAKGVRRGWVCLLLGLAPGVAVGYAAYFWLRARQGVA
ncbi:MAG: DUF2834 domain-containing protein [Myxococcota bacterium]